jgi:hypothetical protein
MKVESLLCIGKTIVNLARVVSVKWSGEKLYLNLPGEKPVIVEGDAARAVWLKLVGISDSVSDV